MFHTPNVKFVKCFVPGHDNPGYVSYPGKNSSGRVCRVKNEHPLSRPYDRYIIMNLNHGLARESDVLPADIIVNFRFQRAVAENAFIKISEDLECVKVSDKSTESLPVEYEESVIPIKNPLLNAYYAYSAELDTTMGQLRNTNLEINFMGKTKINLQEFLLKINF